MIYNKMDFKLNTKDSIDSDVQDIINNYSANDKLNPEGCEVQYIGFNDNDENLEIALNAFEKRGWDPIYNNNGIFYLERKS